MNGMLSFVCFSGALCSIPILISHNVVALRHLYRALSLFIRRGCIIDPASPARVLC